jgi:hypothetical protein
MATDIEAIARRLGAKLVCQVPDVGGGVLCMARLAGIIAALRARRKAVARRTEEAGARQK